MALDLRSFIREGWSNGSKIGVKSKVTATICYVCVFGFFDGIFASLSSYDLKNINENQSSLPHR